MLQYYVLGIVGELEERSLACKHLNTVEIICWQGDHNVDSLEAFLLESGITHGRIHIKH
jgi:hypothetical protein